MDDEKENKSPDTSKTQMFNAIMIGGSGSVGQALVRRLIQNTKCNSVHLLNRKNIEAFVKEEKVTQYQVDMSKLESETTEVLDKIQDKVEVAYITMGVGAPSKTDAETLEKVDVLLPTEFARAAHARGVSHIALLSSVGANINAKKGKATGAGGGLYLHLKGQIEQNLSTLGFSSVGLFRPSVLIGSAATPGFVEKAWPMIEWALPKKYEGIQITDLAAAMVHHSEDCLWNEKKLEQSRIDILEGKDLFGWIPKE
eukprot:CAMPEP_0202724598 /NCGR_PEP_ID=MMETSP1385-20130828/174993_1 /ASSEMBLY_ACC=CAM_ASM_000861 /TAXON_ID=933848 /ORGANISM="Elphidium margaritaceum" /LENGTH=254 /DNA_ID=CAMNT_0049390251 /DNA_START=70 /DNA_END=834 /DNA_ORIENTATION=-